MLSKVLSPSTMRGYSNMFRNLPDDFKSKRIYDISNVDDRMIIGFKSTIGEVELRIIHNRMIGGKINAAKRGDLRSVLPVGYVYDGKTPIIDPDESVRNAIQTVFDQFANTHSAYQVVKYFAENNVVEPVDAVVKLHAVLNA